MKKLPPIHRVALLFNANKIYDREIITGIGHYLGSTRACWDLYLEEDFHCRLAGIESFHYLGRLGARQGADGEN